MDQQELKKRVEGMTDRAIQEEILVNLVINRHKIIEQEKKTTSKVNRILQIIIALIILNFIGAVILMLQ
ncbi:hypothetical protein [Phaeodactylibacter xiamenensis]|uniref:hypothetical protein n=1 Tax=Phaeodactylibacter xiamenensis TaxID=1524460 RepID=UPI0024A97C9D|nr:hypothetical protein [Phaeodactylibacter xiamenensis]